MHRNAIEQLGIELIDPGRWAEAFTSQSRPADAGDGWGTYVCFANEDAAWP